MSVEVAPTLTAVVLARNEARHIQPCLISLRWADRRLVLDSGSVDHTASLAQAEGVEVIVRPFRNFADQRNAALDLVRTPWVLFVDADERIPPALAEEIRTVTSHTGPEAPVGYWAPRHNVIFGRLTRGGGWWPDYQLRLFRADMGRYDPDRAVHELVVLNGPAGHLTQPMVHFNYENMQQFRRKQDEYTALDATILRAAGRRPRPHNFILQPLREFIRRFVHLRGYRDGLHGLRLAVLMTYYEWVKYVKFWRLTRGR